MKNLYLFLGAGLFLLGCPEGKVDTGDTAIVDDTADTSEPVDTMIMAVYYTAAVDVGDIAEYEVELQGIASAVDVEIYQLSGGFEWEEYHELDETFVAGDMSESVWDIALEAMGDWQDQQDSVNTLFLQDMDNVTWAVRAFDPDDVNLQVDCVWFGADATQFPECDEMQLF